MARWLDVAAKTSIEMEGCSIRTGTMLSSIMYAKTRIICFRLVFPLVFLTSMNFLLMSIFTLFHIYLSR